MASQSLKRLLLRRRAIPTDTYDRQARSDHTQVIRLIIPSKFQDAEKRSDEPDRHIFFPDLPLAFAALNAETMQHRTEYVPQQNRVAYDDRSIVERRLKAQGLI
jgi:hypothetical protein